MDWNEIGPVCSVTLNVILEQASGEDCTFERNGLSTRLV